MADPTGTVGQPSDSVPDLLTLATRGGPKFTARLQQLGEAIDRHERALTQLRLGQEAEAALKEAAQQREAAKTDRTAAATALADAKRDAADILAAAKADRNAAATELADAERVAADARDSARRATEAVARADIARRAAEAAEQKFLGKIDRLKVELRAVM